MTDLRILQVGGVDYNVGFSTNDLTDELKAKYDGAVSGAETNRESITGLQEEIDGLKVVKVTEGLESNVKEAYQLQDKDGVVVGAQINVYKDSSLKGVELVDQKLQFTYILESGEESVVDVDVTSFLAESEFKNGLQVTDGVVSVKVAEDTDSNKNFLDFEGDTDGQKSLAVRGMDANKTVTTEVIPVAGGPLADLVKGTVGSELPVGTDIQGLLMSLLCKVEWPKNITESNATLTAKVDAPTVTMATDTVEVGTGVGFTVKNGKSGYTAVASKASGFTYGYSAANDNSKDSTATSVSAVFGTVSINGDDKTTLTVESTGNENQSTNGTSTAASATLSGTIVAIEGSNTCKGTNSSVAYKGSCGELASHYGCSNTGKTSEDYKSEAVAAITSLTANAVTNSASKSFTGAYKYYIGYAAAVPTTSDGIKGLTALINPGWITKDGTTTVSGGGKLPAGNVMVVAVPSSYALDSIMNGFDLESKDSFKSTTVEYELPSGAKVNYSVYAMESAADWNFKTIVIK